jgi:CubicO group peptidase (beta-lactamase class C family)
MIEEIQGILDQAAEITGYALTFGYVDAEGLEFGLGSGNRSFSEDLPNYVNGTANGTDTVQLGSGTKPFTATAIMRLVDQGKVKLEDPAYIHADGPLEEGFNTTME